MASESSRPRSVLVVDDSPFIRRVVRDVLDDASDFVVIGEAATGYEAISQVHALSPDLLTLDVDMPSLDGLHTLGYVMSEAPRPVVMLSAVEDGGDTTMRALELGAVDFVRKPGRADALDLATLRERLLGALRAASSASYRSVPILARPRVTRRDSAPDHRTASHIVVIAASTGGPRALAEIIPALSASLGAAVVIAQHMPSGFTESLARRLDDLSALDVLEARDGDVLLAGHVYVAPGGRHTVVRRSEGGPPRLEVRAGPSRHGVSPAADPLFTSAASVFGVRSVGVVLTGMGQDGALGLLTIRQAGGFAVVQDAATSMVYGMPLAALTCAGADAVARLESVAEMIDVGLLARGCELRLE